MATQKKKKSSSKKRSSGAANTTKRRQSAKPKARNPVNPVRASSKKRSGGSKGRRPSRPRRNPLMGGTGGEILSFAGAGISLGIVQPIVSNAVGRFLPFGQYNSPAITAGSGWLLSQLFKMLPFTRPLSRPTLILGVSTAVIQVVQPFVRGLIGGGAVAPSMMGARYNRYAPNYRYRNGMGAIGVVTDNPPRILPPPPQPPANGARRNGMGSVGVVPGRFGR